MLSRTANELFWMSRHIERAENTARMLDVTYRMSLLPYDVIEPGLAWAEPWAVPLITTGVATEYYRRYPVLSAENVLRFMILDAGNPSSVFCCLRAARESARTVRGAITSEMYEDLNSAWLEVRGYDYARIESGGVSEFLDWVKMRSHMFRGVTLGTLLRDDAYHFIRLATHLERADNTARILDVKYHTLLPSAADVGGAVDYYHPARGHAALATRLHELHLRDAAAPLRRSHLRDRARGGRTARQAALRQDRRRHRVRAARVSDGFPRAHLVAGQRDQPALPGPGVAPRGAPGGRARSLGRIEPSFVRRAPMTYCVAMSLEAGMIFASDSRTNAGVDQVSRFSKMRTFVDDGERVVVTLSSGNLSITQNALNILEQRARAGDGPQHLLNAGSMFDVARLIGDALREVKGRDGPYLAQNNIDASANFLVGGQIRGEPPRLFNVYSEGNFIEATAETCYFQSGETKYGKPIIDRVMSRSAPLVDATKCTIVSFDSTMRSNISVGLPIDLVVYEADSLRLGMQRRIDEDDPYYQMVHREWGEGLRQVFAKLPAPDWA
jgi:putative proteasome-type protease